MFNNSAYQSMNENHSTKPGKYLKMALTNSTNNKIKNENLKQKEETAKFMNNTINSHQKSKEARFSREMQQLQSDIENVLRKFS